MTLWTAQDAALVTGGSATGGSATGGSATANWVAQGISIDTRSLRPGDLFVALRAARDGHDFVAQALENGAAAAMVSRIPQGVAPDAPLLIVPDVMAGLTALGVAGRDRSKARVVAVTGSVGKTSTKEMLREMLSEFGVTHAAEASFNNHWGVPITLARIPQHADWVIVEIGMNRPGEIAPLAKLARPHVALITAIAPAHLEAFGRIEGIAEEKASIFEGLEPGGQAVFPVDLPTSPILQKAARHHAGALLGFGDSPQADLRLQDMSLTETALVLRALSGQMRLAVRLRDAGAHFGMNALGCLAVARALGLDMARAALALGRWQPPAGRGLRQKITLDSVEGLGFTLIDDAFNANPASMQAALATLAATTPAMGLATRAGRRIAILGDMLELGPDESALHAAIADDPALAKVDVVHCVGPRMAVLAQHLPRQKRGRQVQSADDLRAVVHHLVAPGDVVLVKGSKSSHVSRIVAALKALGQPMPDSDEDLNS